SLLPLSPLPDLRVIETEDYLVDPVAHAQGDVFRATAVPHVGAVLPGAPRLLWLAVAAGHGGLKAAAVATLRLHVDESDLAALDRGLQRRDLLTPERREALIGGGWGALLVVQRRRLRL